MLVPESAAAILLPQSFPQASSLDHALPWYFSTEAGLRHATLRESAKSSSRRRAQLTTNIRQSIRTDQLEADSRAGHLACLEGCFSNSESVSAGQHAIEKRKLI